MTEEEENLIGKEFAGCKVISKIGQGGMGTVYKAHHKALNKTVCVKLLAKELSNDKRNLEFFLREARSAAKLNHPNIVHVYNFGKENNNYFIVMSFIDGKSLQEIVEAEGPMSVERATKFTAELLDGLAHAHSKGVIHRDIKPSNILVGSNGQSYLVDFGLAKSLSEEKELTQAGEMIGTAYFMSPEQCLAQKVDNRADLYAVGATFYYLITGKYPFDGKTSIEVMHKHIGTPVPDPILVNQSLPRWASVFIDHAMKKKPEERFQNAEEAKQELLDFSMGKKMVPNPGGDIILDLSAKIHDPDADAIFDATYSNQPEPLSLSVQSDVPPAPPSGLASLDSISIGDNSEPPALNLNAGQGSAYSGSEGVTVDWNSGETLQSYVPPKPSVPPPPPSVSRSADPSMDAGSGLDGMIDRNPGGTFDMYETQSKATASIMSNSYDATVEQQEMEEQAEKERKEQGENADKEKEIKVRKPSMFLFFIKLLTHFALLLAASFFLVMGGAAGTGDVSLLNSFNTNPTLAGGFTAAGIVLAIIAYFLKPVKTYLAYPLYIVVEMAAAFIGGAYIATSGNTDISSKLLQAVSMIIQNSTGQLLIIYSVISFLFASSLSAFESKLSKFLGALVFMFSIWCFFAYLRIDHEFFGFNTWGIAAAVSALLAFYYAVTNSSDRLLGPKVFMIPAYLFLLFMICIPNINRAAENNYQKVSKEWEVFHALQKDDPYLAKGKEPKGPYSRAWFAAMVRRLTAIGYSART